MKSPFLVRTLGSTLLVLALPPHASAAKVAARNEVSNAHVVVLSGPNPGDAQRNNERARAAQQSSDARAAEQTHPVRGLPLPRGMDEREVEGTDWVGQISYYGILGLLVLGAVTLLYRYLCFRFSLDEVPQVVDPGSRSGVNVEPEVPPLAPAPPRPARPVASPPRPAPRAAEARPAQLSVEQLASAAIRSRSRTSVNDAANRPVGRAISMTPRTAITPARNLPSGVIGKVSP